MAALPKPCIKPACAPEKPIEVEVETLQQLQEAIDAKADRVMLDNFTLEQTHQAIALAKISVRLKYRAI